MLRYLTSQYVLVALLSGSSYAWAETAVDSEAAATARAVDLSSAPPEPTPSSNVSNDGVNYPERRCGFAFGVTPSAMLGAATGYPNNALLIGRDEYYTNTGFSAGGAASVWLGVAVADGLVVGVGGQMGVMMNEQHRSEFGGLAFHIDAFPLFGLGGPWRELGVALEVGLSGTTTKNIDTDVTSIDAGLGSRVAVGAFYEGVRLWKLSMGPYLAADTIFSQSARTPTLSIGWRTAFYGGP